MNSIIQQVSRDLSTRRRYNWMYWTTNLSVNRMSDAYRNSEQICQRGEQLYEQHIRANVKPSHRGHFVAIDVDTGDYAMDADQMAAVNLLRDRRPGASIFLMRIGFPAAVRLPSRPWTSRLSANDGITEKRLNELGYVVDVDGLVAKFGNSCRYFCANCGRWWKRKPEPICLWCRRRETATLVDNPKGYPPLF